MTLIAMPNPPRLKGRPGVVATPCVSWTYTPAMLSVFSLALPPDSRLWFEDGGTFPDEKRNMLIRRFLDTPGAAWMYFNDSDHVVQPDTLARLLDTRLDVVSAFYVGRASRGVDVDGHRLEHEFAPEAGVVGGSTLDPTRRNMIARLQQSFEQGAVCEVEWAGAGAMLVQRHVLEKVSPPWFYRRAEGGEDEDVWFCEKVRAAGFKVHVHCGARVGHMQTVVV